MKDNNKQTEAIETFLLRINSEIKKQAEQKAKTDNRSLNGHIVNLIKTDLNK